MVKDLEDTMKRSMTLALKKLSSDPTSLGARPKDTYVYKNQTKQIPNTGLNQPSDVAQGIQSQQAATLACHQVLYQSLEEKAVPASNERTKDWVHVSKFEDSWQEDLQQDNHDHKIQWSVTFDVALGQPLTMSRQ